MLRRLVLLVAVVPLFAAKPSGPTSPAGGAAAELAGEVVAGLSFDQQIALVDPGAEPRSVVRYRPVPGATATYETVARTSMDMSMTGPDGTMMSMPMGMGEMPAVVMTARNTVGQPVANGLVPVTVEQLGARLDGGAPGMADVMRESLSGLDGMKFQMFVDPDGKPVQLDIVGGGDAAMADLVQQIADQMMDRMVLFPSEPIGPGARWTTTIDMSMSGLELTVTQTSTARAITADAIDLDVTMKLDLGQGGLTMPGMPPGVAPEVTRFVGSGGGTTHVDLGTLVGTGSMTMDMDVAMTIATPGQPPMAMSMKMKQSTEMRLAK